MTDHEPGFKEYQNLTHAYAPGGLMRCCIATIDRRAGEGAPVVGEVLPCDYCDSSVIYDVSAWRWNHD